MTPFGAVLAVILVACVGVAFVWNVRTARGRAEERWKAYKEAERNHDGAHFAEVIAGKIDCPFCLPNHRRR
jgi:hypothetical protein